MTLTGIECMVTWNGDEPMWCLISFGEQIEDEDGDIVKDSFGVRDENIFYYLDAQEVEQLQTAIKNGASRFQVDKAWYIDLKDEFSLLSQED